jgi:cation transport regulator ChaC
LQNICFYIKLSSSNQGDVVMGQANLFGYGSLLSRESLLASVPEASAFVPAYIRGFRRVFNFSDTDGFIKTNLDVAGEAFCAANIEAVPDQDSVVNGALFTVKQEDLPGLIDREHGYELVCTEAYDFETKRLLGQCGTFLADDNQNVGEFIHNGAAQLRYLQVCLDGARSHGNEFYELFLQSTHIGGVALGALPELIEQVELQRV